MAVFCHDCHKEVDPHKEQHIEVHMRDSVGYLCINCGALMIKDSIVGKSLRENSPNAYVRLYETECIKAERGL